MGHSSQLSGWLDLAVAEASQLPPSQQDKLARAVLLMISGEEASSIPDQASFGVILDFVKSVLPVRDGERTVALICGALILVGLAPFLILSGISAIVREARTQSSPAPAIEWQARSQQVEEQAGGEQKVTDHGDDLRQALEERAEHSQRQKQRLEAFYSLWEAGLFEERMVLRLAKDPVQYQTRVVSPINRAIALSPGEVATVLKSFQLALERLRTEEYTCRDIQDYYDVKDRVAEAIRKTLDSEPG